MCDPDYNAWERMMNDPPIPNPELTLRTAAGHIHIGYDEPDLEVSLKIIKIMDLFLGVPSILLDNDKERRKMYGKAGCFRIKPYGFEYRTLSNFWIKSKESVEWMFQNVTDSIDAYNNGFELSDEDGKLVVDCINNQDGALAEMLIAKFNIKLKVEEKECVDL